MSGAFESRPIELGAPAGHMAAAPARPRDRYARLSLMSFLALFGAWFAVTGAGLWPPLADPVFLPSPAAVGRAFVRVVTKGYQNSSLLHHLAISMFRFGAAFLFCVVAGVGTGLLMGMNRTAQAILDPIIEITRPIPKLAILPLLIIWFGIGEMTKVVVIVLALFPMMSISAMQAVGEVGQRKVQAAYALGATRGVVFRRVLLPGSLPGIFTAIRVSIGVGITMLVGAEMVATSDGIAWMSLSASEFLQTDVVLVGVLIMAGLGYGLDRLARWAEVRLVHWSGKEG